MFIPQKLSPGLHEFLEKLRISGQNWYIDNLQKHIEKFARRYKIKYLVDMDPYDYDNIVFNQKTNR